MGCGVRNRRCPEEGRRCEAESTEAIAGNGVCCIEEDATPGTQNRLMSRLIVHGPCTTEARREIIEARVPKRCAAWSYVQGRRIGEAPQQSEGVVAMLLGRRRAVLPTNPVGEAQSRMRSPLILGEERNLMEERRRLKKREYKWDVGGSIQDRLRLLEDGVGLDLRWSDDGLDVAEVDAKLEAVTAFEQRYGINNVPLPAAVGGDIGRQQR